MPRGGMQFSPIPHSSPRMFASRSRPHLRKPFVLFAVHLQSAQVEYYARSCTDGSFCETTRPTTGLQHSVSQAGTCDNATRHSLIRPCWHRQASKTGESKYCNFAFGGSSWVSRTSSFAPSWLDKTPRTTEESMRSKVLGTPVFS